MRKIVLKILKPKQFVQTNHITKEDAIECLLLFVALAAILLGT